MKDRMKNFQGAATGSSGAGPTGGRFSVSGPKCPVCSKSVYAAEEVKALGNSWHAACFCCKECGKSLRGGQYKEHDGWPYCQADYGKLYGPKGIGFGTTLGDTGIAKPSPVAPVSAAAAAAEPIPAARLPEEVDGKEHADEVASHAAASQDVGKDAEGVSEAPAPLKDRMQAFAGATAGTSPPAKPKLGVAARFGGTAPKCPVCSKSVYAAEEVKALGHSWHTLCFCCKACGKSLRGGNYKEHDGAPYCSADYGKLFGPKGLGFGTTLGDTGVAAKPDA
jgi:hypothetical protein